MEIKRNIYLNKLISKKHNGLIKVVTGIRRCGKSYLLFNLFKDHLLAEGVNPRHIIEIAFDSFENKKFRDPDVLYPYMKEQIQDEDMYYVLLDEVQLLDEFEAVLNSLIRMKNVDIYVTGSNAHFLSKDVITEFRGRGDEVHMYPLSFAEFMSVYPGTKENGWREYVVYGGLPLVLNFKTPEEKITFLKALFEETYISDIVGRHKIRNRAELEELLNILSSAIGSLTNPTKLSATFKSMKQKNISMPVYSDSRNALSWVKQKKCKTKLERTPQTEKLFQMIERAEIWLKENKYTTPLLKWETDRWGEVPADFGRK